ncbi:energy transducer TonB [Campylobacter sp. MIT 21-1685]|uniref:energy transducer TonB n=1 Tax=unclassified Campylobacter TaxID=2593542 RepID=UPI00224AC432|nr:MULTISPECIES: energy transducer TonB [unclassified Campylobacter]MCX2683434.1 energy transducer TonB [Campylobacter sp. MIT 21-1684]MCX2751745.1 energy transducer TonB [Campylobacter sp. MIT 21-1682]MCX2807946.1 energy transducer TonB [Campylobacter sp. MIT 21-1685]
MNSKNFFLNHKAQAFYFTLLLFSPLAFLFSKAVFFTVQIPAQEKFTLAVQHFITQTFTQQPSPQQIEDLPLIEPEKEFVKPVKKIHKKRMKKPIKKSVERKFQPPPQAQNFSEKIQQVSKEVQVFQYGKEDNPFLREIKTAIDKSRNYPRQAIKMRIQGRVVVEFLWKEEQILSEVKIIQSSGYRILDDNALQTIQLASKHFPPHNSDARIKIPIEYSLH